MNPGRLWAEQGTQLVLNKTCRPTAFIHYTHCKSKTVPQATLSRGTSASSIRTQLCQIHQCDQYCNGFGLRVGAGEPGSRPASPGHILTRQSGSGILQGGAGREASLVFPCLICKNEISNKHGGKNPQLSSKEKKSPLGLEAGKLSWLPLFPHQPAKQKGLFSLTGALPLPCSANRGQDSRPDTRPPPGASSQLEAEPAWALETSRPIPPCYRWGN